MAKDREKVEQQNKEIVSSFNFIVPFSPIPGLAQSEGRRRTTCRTRPHICARPHEGGSLSTSTPYSRRSLPLEFPPLGDGDGCLIRTPSLPVLDSFDSDNSICTPSAEENHKADASFRIPVFNLDTSFVDGEDGLEKCKNKILQNNKTVNLKNETTRDDVIVTVSESDTTLLQDMISSSLEFKKPQSSPSGSRKRLPVATVTQLHKDSLRDESHVPCYCHGQIRSKVEKDFDNISNISVQSVQSHHSNSSQLSACVDLSVVSHNDSGYQTFNSTASSLAENSPSFSNASSKDISPVPSMPNITLPPLLETADVKQLTFQDVLEKHSPLYQKFGDSMIGRKIGLESVDIIAELHNKGVSTCLHLVFDMLDATDLKCVCSVSRTWKRVCLEDTRVRQRLKDDKAKTRDKALFLGKENLLKLKQRGAAAAAEPTDLTSLKKPALSCNSYIQNKEKIVPSIPISPTKLLTRGEQYVHEASKLKNEEYLDKCPRCIFPAKVHKVQERGCCTKQTCSFDYCIKCRMAFHGSKPCAIIEGNQAKMGGVATKRSKKNLRRL